MKNNVPTRGTWVTTLDGNVLKIKHSLTLPKQYTPKTSFIALLQRLADAAKLAVIAVFDRSSGVIYHGPKITGLLLIIKLGQDDFLHG